MLTCQASRPYVDAVVLGGLDSVEHWSVEAAEARLDILSPSLPVTVTSASFCGGESNDVWRLDEGYLKVCWRADRTRLLRDVEVARHLPDSVPHARVRSFGFTDRFSWALTDAVDGTPVSDVIGTLSTTQQRDIFGQITDVLRSLHDWDPDVRVRQILDSRPARSVTRPLTVWASDLVILPTDLLNSLFELARRIPFVEADLLDGVEASNS